MRRVLLVSYYSPPRKGVATARTQALERYLARYGWQPTTLTAPLENAPESVLQTPYVDVARRLKGLVGIGDRSTHAVFHTAPAEVGKHRSFRQRAIAWGFAATSYPDAQVGWIAGTPRLREILASGTYDAILSSCPPYTTNLMLACAGACIPWVADFRDLWAENDARRAVLVRACDRALERWSLRHAAALTTVSEPLAANLRARHPRVPVEVIPNAFDPAEWEHVPFETERVCTIVYAGQLYVGRRNPRPVFRAIRALLDDRSITVDELRFDLYTQDEPWLRAAIDAFGLGEVVRVHGMRPRDEVLRAERRADRLLVLLWDGENTEGILTGKIFEYLGARRRIVVVGGPETSAVDDVLRISRAGARFTDDEALRRELIEAVVAHRQGAVATTSAADAAPYCATELARRFAELLDRVAVPVPSHG